MCKSTDDGTWRRLDPAERAQLAATLRERGLRLTPQRAALCEAIFGCPGHICAEHVLAEVMARQPELRLNKSTVYRNLDLLVELGLVSEHKCGDGPAQYEPATRGQHSHLLCRRCGTLINLDEWLAKSLRQELQTRHEFVPDLESYPVFGVCASCRG